MSSRRRFGLGIADQCLSSASNALALFSMARVSNVAEFGQIAVVMTVLMFIVAIARGSLGTPLALSANTDRFVGDSQRSMAVAGIGGAAVAGVSVLLVGIAGLPTACLLICVATPIVLMQDMARQAFLVSGESARAFASDACWCAATGTALVVTWVVPEFMTSTGAVLFWFAGAVVALVLAWGLRAPVPRIHRVVRWLRLSAASRMHFGLDTALAATTPLVTAALSQLFVGHAAVAAILGAGTLLGPINVLFAAVSLLAIPALRQSGDQSVQRLWSLMRKPAIGMSGGALLIGAAAFVVPPQLGQLLLGPTWESAQPLLFITGLQYAFLAWSFASQTILKARAQSQRVLTLRVIHTATSCLGVIVAGATAASAVGIAWSLVVAAALSAVVGHRLVMTGDVRSHRMGRG